LYIEQFSVVPSNEVIQEKAKLPSRQWLYHNVCNKLINRHVNQF
jgi:hypothetical protein